jgi:hypothetical protein
MTSSGVRTTNSVLKGVRGAIGVALLVPALEGGALAQTTDNGGFAVREVSLSTGYASVQLPPITLDGVVPNEVLNADLIATGAGAIDWRRVTPRTTYTFELFGTYTARTRYAQLSAPGGTLTFGVSRALGRRWRVGTAVADAIANSDQVAFQPTQAGRLVEDAQSFDDLAGTAALARSPSPDLSQAVLFVPITRSLVGSDLYGDRVMVSSVSADATYTHSVRLATSFHGSYTTDRRISTRNELGLALPFPDSTSEDAGVGVRFGRSERSQLTLALDWSKLEGTFTEEALSATLGYGWSGRKWFAGTTVGAAVRPFQTPVAVATVTTTVSDRTPAIIGGAVVGYKFRAQTLLVQYSRAAHDEYGSGGRNIATGFQGHVESVVGSWRWSAPSSHWTTQADFSMVKRPGNFSYIYAWLSTVGIGRQLGPNVRLMSEALFERHGSRAFEGFDLTREEARLNVIWTPQRRSARQEESR